VRRLIAFLCAVAGLACANIVSPPGGPQRKVPPALLSVTPESGSVDVTDKNAVFSFDVIVNDRSGHNGSLAGSFIVSPAEGGTVVNWKRDRIEVRPKRGFRPGLAYSITMLAGVSDLNGNAIRDARVIVFSTGPTIPEFSVHGRAFDWMTERVVSDARVDVIRLPDSLPYLGTTDSAGQFVVGPLDSGTYHVRMLVDNNHNGIRDAAEPWDSATVVVKAESPFVELRAAMRDTVAPRILTAGANDSLAIAVSFDRPLDPATQLTPASFRVQRADSSLVTVLRVLTQSEFLKARTARDSARRDSLAKADTSARRPVTPAPSPVREPALTTVVVPKPSLPAPTKDLILEVDPATPLRPLSTYRITAIGARGLTGLSRPTDRVVTTPQRDTTKVAPKAP
jgi:hypothetical protein